MQRTLSPVRERFFRLIQRDRYLASAIQNFHVDWYEQGMVAHIEPVPGQFKWIARKLLKIASILLALGNFEAIEIGSRNRILTFLVADLIETCPSIQDVIMEGDREHRLEITQARQKNFLNSLLAYHEQRSSIFVISTDGIYKDIRIHKGTISKIPPEKMLGQPIDRFLGLETAAYLKTKIQQAYQTSQSIEACYSICYPDGELRQYKADIIPVSNTESVLLLCNRSS